MPLAFMLFPISVLATPYASIELGISEQTEYLPIYHGSSSGLSWGGGIGYDFEDLSAEIIFKSYPQLSFRNDSGDFLGLKTTTTSFNLKYHPDFLESNLSGVLSNNISPFIGIGFGVNYNNSSGSINDIFFDSNHVATHPVLMVGVSYPINTNLDLILKYQDDIDSSIVSVSYIDERKESIHDFSLGLKYKFITPKPVLIKESLVVEHNYLNQVLTLSDDVAGLLFLHDSSVIEKADALDDMMSTIDLSSIQSIEIKGYTDSTGSRFYNDRLSLDRAVATMMYLKDYLLDKGYSVENIPIVTSGHGETMNVESNETDIGRKMNRRVEIIIKFKPKVVKTEI
ncbi:OmpA family protein [Aliivibrio fischeri]|uniref:OmpA family protein n=1 Tax=Aliivibrio fischeri TaxID=668 RepID=UPI0018C62AF6|nr:OmpA family protein [Aliivibrio fischeri]